MQAKPPHPHRVFSSSPGGSLPRGPHQIRTWRFPPSGSSADVARGSRATTVRSCGDMIRRRRSAGHGSLRTITPTRAAFARPGPGGYPFPGVIARMQPSDSLIPIGLGSGRPLPSAYPGARATRSNEGLPGVRAVLFQRAVVVDPAGCGALLAHGAGPAVAFRLHEALGTQEDVVSRLQGLRPTRSRTYASATALPRSPQGSLPAWVGWPLTGRGSHPLDDTQGFMTYSSIPLDRPAWPHHATTPTVREIAVIPAIKRGSNQAQLTQRLSHGQLRALDQPDEFVLLGGRPSHVPLSESEAVTPFFSSRFSSTNSATTCLSRPFSCRKSVTSVDVASRVVSPTSRFLPASRNSLLHR